MKEGMAMGNNKSHSNCRLPGNSYSVTSVALTRPMLPAPSETPRHNQAVVATYCGSTV